MTCVGTTEKYQVRFTYLSPGTKLTKCPVSASCMSWRGTNTILSHIRFSDTPITRRISLLASAELEQKHLLHQVKVYTIFCELVCSAFCKSVIRVMDSIDLALPRTTNDIIWAVGPCEGWYMLLGDCILRSATKETGHTICGVMPFPGLC